MPETLNLICLSTRESTAGSEGRVAAKVLSASVIRILLAAEAMVEWDQLFEKWPPKGGTPTVKSAWNRLLLDTPLRVAWFERAEVPFPCLPWPDY